MHIYSHTGPNPQYHLWLIHGFGDDHTIFDSVFQSPLAEEANIFTIDLPGFGKSPLEAIPATAHLQHLLKNIEAQNLQIPTVLLGHSMSGVFATYLAQHTHLKKILLMVLDSSLYADKARITGDVNTYQHAEDFKQSVLQKVQVLLPEEPDLAHYLESAGSSDAETLMYCSKEGIVLRDQDKIAHAYSQLSCPKYYLIGDRSFTVRGHQKAMELCKNELVWIPNAGHWPMLDTPNTFWHRVHSLIRIQLASLLN